jgi:ankyrin repeat protein
MDAGDGVYATLIPALKDLQKSLAGLKRETSDDPRKELANLGVAWSGDNFLTAVKEGDERLVRLFLAGGMRIVPTESQGRSLPVMLALNKVDPGATLDILIDGGLDVNYVFAIAGPFGSQQTTLLGRAIEEPNAALVRSLITRHVDVNRRIVTFGAMGAPVATYPLPSAIYWKRYEIAGMLVDAGADVAVGEYLSYREILDALRQPSAIPNRETLEQLRDRVAPSGAARETADARQRLANVERELTQVALASLRAMRQSNEKLQYERRYDDLQKERQKLRMQLGISETAVDRR